MSLNKNINFECFIPDNMFSNFNNSNAKIKISGTVTTLNKLIIAVREIDKATSPLANDVKIFEVTPPGAAAIIITPTASSEDKGHNLTIIKATTGSKKI